MVRFELSADTLALLRQARGVLDDEHGTNLPDDGFVAALCGAVIDGAPATEPTGRARFQIAMTVCQRCRQGWQEGAGAQIAVDAPAVERAMCDAQHIGSMDGETPERASQDIPPSIARLVWRRDSGRCRVPGCRSARGLELHHIVHRAEGGDHAASNLVLLCSSCHLAHHRGTLAIAGTADQLEVCRPEESPGPAMPPVVMANSLAGTTAPVAPVRALVDTAPSSAPAAPVGALADAAPSSVPAMPAAVMSRSVAGTTAPVAMTCETSPILSTSAPVGALPRAAPSASLDVPVGVSAVPAPSVGTSAPMGALASAAPSFRTNTPVGAAEVSSTQHRVTTSGVDRTPSPGPGEWRDATSRFDGDVRLSGQMRATAHRREDGNAPSKLDTAILHTQAKAALTGLGWKPAIAHAAVAAAAAAQGTGASLEALIFESLRRCPVPNR